MKLQKKNTIAEKWSPKSLKIKDIAFKSLKRRAKFTSLIGDIKVKNTFEFQVAPKKVGDEIDSLNLDMIFEQRN